LRQTEGTTTKWRVNFFDKDGDEMRSLTVDAGDEDGAETAGEAETDRRSWPDSFKVADAEPVE